MGHWFASEEVYGIKPDMITCAKGLTSGYIPMGAVIISDEVMANCADPDEAVLFSNGFTYSGHPVAAAAALKNMEIFEREGILENVLDVSPHFQERLAALSKYEIVGDARGMGLLGCIEGKAEDLEAERRLGQMIDDAREDLGLVVATDQHGGVLAAADHHTRTGRSVRYPRRALTRSNATSWRLTLWRSVKTVLFPQKGSKQIESMAGLS